MNQKGIYGKYLKSNHSEYDFGRGKSKTSKARNRRAIKRRAKNLMNKDFNK